VIGYTDVPDVKKDGLGLSGLVVKSGGAPTLRRTFAAGEPIALMFQVARAKGNDSHVTVSYVISDALGQAIATADVPSDRAGANGVDEHQVAIRMPTVAGRYVVRIEATDGRRSARREIAFTVR
jgi:hypothetical protein